MSIQSESFKDVMNKGYTFDCPAIQLGVGIFEGQVHRDVQVSIPIKTLNRHGLIAGSTGSGKTKTLQILAEQLSQNGIPSLIMDLKGDLSGIGAKADVNSKITERMEMVGLPYTPNKSPVEFLTISQEYGTKLRSTVIEFGPLLLSKILDLNETQQGVLALVFQWADDNKIPLLDLKDLKIVLNHLATTGKQDIAAEYGTIGKVTSGTIIRKILELEQQGAEIFFGEPSFEIDDLIKVNADNRGIVSVFRVTDIQDKPKLFSTFMIQLLAELYHTLPEVGDLDKPKFMIFIDEAHLVFNHANSALLDQIEMTIKLIRSKGVGVIFITQNPADIPESILSQLGLKIQHSLRAFTAKDRKKILLASQNFPLSEFYTIDQSLTSLGIGEALITGIDMKGIPTPLVHALLRAPESRMGILSPEEIKNIVSSSTIHEKYANDIDRISAYEILTKKLNNPVVIPETEKPSGSRTKTKEEKSIIEKIITNSTTKQLLNTATREITRGLLGVLGIKKRSRKGWF
jgi:DNA helicase HerA-like ATPase